MPTRVLLVGLDGATFDLIRPWTTGSEPMLPHLARLIREGSWGPLRSTVPPATFPAWTSLMTGVNPGKHGVFDFTRRVPGAYQVEFINATYRRKPSAWRMLSQAGRRVAVIGLPATYPPEDLNGVLISGFDSPVSTGIDRSFVSPASLYDEILRQVGAYEITDFQEVQIGPGWHDEALDKLHHALRRRTEIATFLMDREPWDCFFVHYGESDTVAHHFWAFHDTDSPRYDAGRAARLGDAIQGIYQALDTAVGRLLDHSGSDSTIMIVSDHGSGGSGERVLHLNRWLAQQGWLRFASGGRRGRALSSLKKLGLMMPVPLQEWAFRGPARAMVSRVESDARFGGIDWRGTSAFSEEVNTFPSIWLNVDRREPAGVVSPGQEYERTRDTILERLAGWRNPDTGDPVVARAWRREELYKGDAVGMAPDIVLELALDDGYSYTVLPSRGRPGPALSSLDADERLGAKGGSMNGSHRPYGVLLMAGAGVRTHVEPLDAHITDVAPTLLHLLQCPIPIDRDGRVLGELMTIDPGTSMAHPITERAVRTRSYTDAQVELLDSRLRGLGYRD